MQTKPFLANNKCALSRWLRLYRVYTHNTSTNLQLVDGFTDKTFPRCLPAVVKPSLSICATDVVRPPLKYKFLATAQCSRVKVVWRGARFSQLFQPVDER